MDKSKRQRLKKPHSGVFEEFLVSRRTVHCRHWSGPDGGSHVAAFSKENEDPNKPKGVKTLLSRLPVEVSVLAKVMSRRK